MCPVQTVTHVSGRSYNQQLTRIRIVNERLARYQEVDSSNPLAPTNSFPSQINVLRRVLSCYL